MYNVLLVEDEERILFANKIILERKGGYNVQTAVNLAEARKCVQENQPDIIILDIMLPDGSGLDFLEELRRDKNIPVLLLTALSESGDELKGIAAGGDDYITKPYNNDVLLGRIEMVLRRTYSIPDTLTIGGIKIDIAAKKAFFNGEDMGFTPKEYSLFERFAGQPEKVMSADYLYEKAWGQKMLGDDSTLRKTISSLRTKLLELDAGFTITVSRGEGYYLERT
ncbi:MAG: response regulator transcription factor [Defluviitaleaceae bacterium]|nr:response regulator transcription factor [Defluviitaleaceae bacterium]MCL2240086.1 response regulator transcription factor [Defluviitaleaceae bacterium]